MILSFYSFFRTALKHIESIQDDFYQDHDKSITK